VGPLRDRLIEAQHFWTFHKLEEIVTQEEFVMGVLGFKDIPETMSRIEEEARPQTNSLATILANESTSADELLNLLISLTYQQKSSFRTYWYRQANIENSLRIEKTKRDHLKSLTTAQLIILVTCCLAATTQ
jgi:hypothetical protein